MYVRRLYFAFLALGPLDTISFKVNLSPRLCQGCLSQALGELTNLTNKLTNLILSVPMSLLVLRENPGPHFVQRLFSLMSLSLNIMYLVGICICYVF